MIRGEWRFQLPLLEDELLSSWLARSGFAHGLSPYRFSNYFLPRVPIWNRDIDRSVEDAALARLSSCSGISQRRLESATLRAVEQQLSGEQRRQGDVPFLLCVGIYHRERRRFGLQFCPECLAERPAYFRRTWRLGFSISCTRHQRLLLDACPACGSVLAPHRVTGLVMDRCHRCGASLVRSVPHLKPAARLGRFCERLADCLFQGSDPLFGETHRASDIFLALRVLAGVVSVPYIREPLRAFLDLPPEQDGIRHQRLGVFEHSRLPGRIACLEVLERWTAGWPGRFRDGASAAGLSQRSFSRRRVPAFLTSELQLLPEGRGRQRTTSSPVFDVELRRLRRQNVESYRQERADRLLRAVREESK